MILPNKYIALSESFIGLSALILEVLYNKTLTIDKLWSVFNNKQVEKGKLREGPTFQKFIYVLEFMYMSEMISYNEKGEIKIENQEHKTKKPPE